MRELEEALARRKKAEDELRRLNEELSREISERKEVEEKKAKLEAQNSQLQKAESLGIPADSFDVLLVPLLA